MNIMGRIRGRISGYLKEHPLFFSILLNLIFFAAVVVKYGQNYETNDDPGMAGIIYGVYGSSDAHAVFINYFWAWILKSFAQMMPGIPVYPIAMDIGFVVSFIAICYVLLKKNWGWGLFYSIIILGAFAFECYHSVQFTKVAACLAVAGVLLLAEGHWFVSVIYLLVGSMWRYEIFLGVLPLIGGYGIFKLLRACKNREYPFAWKLIGWGIGAVAVCLFFHLADSRIYQSDPDWKEYVEFNQSRAELMDYGFPDYYANEEALNALGVGFSDYYLYSNWDFADPDRFTTDRIQQMIALREEKVFSLDVVKAFLKEFLVAALYYKWIWCMLLAMTVALCETRKNCGWVVYCLVVLLGIECYLYWQGRFLVNRVDTGLFLAGTVLLAGVAMENGKAEHWLSPPRMAVAVVLTSILLQIPYLHSLHSTGEGADQVKAEEQSITGNMSEDKEHLYLISELHGSEMYTLAYGIWDRMPTGLRSNSYLLGGWGCFSPTTDDVLDAYNITNPFRDCVDAEVYLVDTDSSHVGAVISYIQSYYNQDANAVQVKQIGWYPIYKIVTKEPDYSGLSRGDDKLLNADFEITMDGGMAHVSGSAYVDGKNSYQSEAYITVTDSEGTEKSIYLTQKENSDCTEVEHGQYSLFETDFEWTDEQACEITLWYQCEGVVFCKQIKS
jgi:hypothetical protein